MPRFHVPALLLALSLVTLALVVTGCLRSLSLAPDPAGGADLCAHLAQSSASAPAVAVAPSAAPSASSTLRHAE